MKEAFWGVLVIALGLFGVFVINVFQNVTVDNDRTYYVLKEATEASAYESLDFAYYRLKGDYRIVEEKFVENVIKRFSNNINPDKYTLVIDDINERPPRVSLYIRKNILSGVDISNRVEGIIESKNSEEEITGFLGITSEEWQMKVINTVRIHLMKI